MSKGQHFYYNHLCSCDTTVEYTDASFTLDTYTHVTSDMQKNASAVVNNMMQQFLINGKRMAKNVYAKTREECEEMLAELIKTMKAEIAELKKATLKG